VKDTTGKTVVIGSDSTSCLFIPCQNPSLKLCLCLCASYTVILPQSSQFINRKMLIYASMMFTFHSVAGRSPYNLYRNLLSLLQMGVKFVKTPLASPSTQTGNSNTNGGRGRTQKLNPTQKDLPLPRLEHHLRWGKVFLPLLYAWAGSLNDPFGMNGKMANKVEIIWMHVFPDVVLKEADKPVVIKVVRAFSQNLITHYNPGLV